MSTTSAAYLTFFVGDNQFAARAADVSEVFRRPRITRVPNGPPSLLGVAGLRGAPAPVVSLARLLGQEDSPSDEARLLLLAGEQSIGLAVDRVGRLASLPVTQDGEGGGQVFGRLYRLEDSALRVVDLEALLRSDFSRPAAPRRARATDAEEAAQAAVVEHLALLGFELAGQSYALPLDEVEEVQPLTTPTPVAESHEAAIGVVNLRGELLPVVSLRGLLGLDAAQGAGARLVVARIGEARVGLAVDRLTAILRPPVSAIDATPAALNRGRGTAQVEAICRLPDALVAVLSAKRLFSDDKTAQILADGRSEAKQMAAQASEATERFVIFRLGEEEYGLPLSVVDEVARLPEALTRVPNAPAFIDGVLNLRGKVTPIIDQRRRFDSAAGDEGGAPRIIVTTVDNRQAGFIVDAVSEILPLRPDQIDDAPALTADAGRLFSRIASLEDGKRLILLVEPRELLDQAERDLLAALDGSATP